MIVLYIFIWAYISFILPKYSLGISFVVVLFHSIKLIFLYMNKVKLTTIIALKSMVYIILALGLGTYSIQWLYVPNHHEQVRDHFKVLN